MNLLCLILAASPNTKGKRCAVGEWWKGGVVFHEMISWWGGTVKMIEGKKSEALKFVTF